MSIFNKILAVVDPTTDDQKAFKRALLLAQKTGASVTAFLSIYDFSYEMTTMLTVDERETMRQAVVDDKTDWLANIVEPLAANSSISVDIKVVWHNRPYESVLFEVIDHSYDLIVKGTHEHDTLKSVIFTPTDWHILRKSPVPVLLVKEHDWPSNGNILAAVDVGSEDDEHHSLNKIITKTAGMMADLLEGKVNLVNSYPGTPVNIAIEIPEFDPVGYTESVKQHHAKCMLEHAQKFNIPQENQHLSEGLPEDVIPSVAKTIDAELVVIGTVGRTGITAALIGNTAEHTIDSLNCDVLAIKPEGFECPLKH
ncbi:MAG: universal stress protein UspE [Aliiglaciecola sp.]|uniref:universal stress protein UspE n=1 Tax=Aliiglaciecola sp. TaxID=1872441 RepID=UPI0032996C35